MLCPNQSKRRGFTLVELLVVIGIIALLISILLPALKKVKEQANSIRCMANMKQVMTACMMYTTEYKGALPIPVSIGNFNRGLPGENGSLMYYMSDFDTSLGGRAVLRWDAGALWKFLVPGFTSAVPGAEPDQRLMLSQGARLLFQVMNCPTELEEQFRPVYHGGMIVNAGFSRNFSYSWNRHIRLAYTGLQPPYNVPACRKISQVKSPADKVLLMEELAPNDGICYMLNNGTTINTDDEPAFRHNGKGNYGFADGHVATMTPGQLGFIAPKNKNSNEHTSYDPGKFGLVLKHFHLTK